MTETYNELLARLARASALAPGWTETFRDTPRADYIPDQATASHDDGTREDIDRVADPARWADVVNSDVALVTAVDAAGDPVSSCSMPYMVASMLRHLAAHPGHRALEIGTGTGWNAALLSARLGGANVTSIEIDPDVMAPARERLNRLPQPPRLILGDGAAGDPDGAPYDRLIATCAVRTVPPAWITQTRGVLVVPWGTVTGAGALLRLHSDGHTATGSAVDTSSFMWLRAQAPHRTPNIAGPEEEGTTGLDPRMLLDHDARFAIGVRLPFCRVASAWGTGEEADECTVYLRDEGHDPSSAWADYIPGRDRYDIGQQGPRRLWDEAAEAHAWWVKHDRPDVTRYGLTVDNDGRHTVWLDDPDGETWPLP